MTEVINLNRSGSNIHEVLTTEEQESSGASSSQQQESLDSIIECRQLITLLKHYKARFSGHVPFEDNNQLEYLDHESLEKLLDETKYSMSAHNTMKYSDKMFMTRLTCIEQLAVNFTPLKLQGLTATAGSDPEILDTVHELMLEFANMLYVHPGYRLGYQLAFTAFTLHTINSAKEVIQAQHKTTVPTNVKSQFDNL